MSSNKRDYVSVTYNENDRPFTEYPDQLACYLVQRYNLTGKQKLLDLGCGRGEFLRGFMRHDLQGYGVDQSMLSTNICPDAEIKQSDLEKDNLPYDNNFFDVIFSKSVLEHFYYPENLVQEIYRILKPSGLVITMVPDWETVYKVFYNDYTHRTPFTKTSLKDIFVIHGFDSVESEKFRQLPLIWDIPWLLPISKLVAVITPESMKKYSKFIRFSKEVMLLCSASKPKKI